MKQSQLVTKTKKVVSQQEVSINAQLLERAGYVSKLMSGVYTYLPLGLRVLSKIEAHVREAMNGLGGQEILLPALQPRAPWDVTGRWNTVDVLYKIKVGDKEFCLGPTHEEIVAPLVKEYITSYRDLPRAVYQIQTKFRNEPRAKSGLLRGREFRMKDLYSFHATEADLDTYYHKVTEAYIQLFRKCGLGDITYFTFASGGTFTKYSHEFQAVTVSGEDTIFVCEGCRVAVNQEIVADQSTCPTCSSKDLVERKSIEVGNIFKLMYRFSEPFNLVYSDAHDEKKNIPMGCYGLGTSRLIGAIVEALHDDRGIMWPVSVAPYTVHFISLARTPEMKAQAEALYEKLNNASIEVLFDDRECNAGEKFADADLIGIPLRIVMSEKTVAQNSLEVKARRSTEAALIPIDSLEEYVKDFVKSS